MHCKKQTQACRLADMLGLFLLALNSLEYQSAVGSTEAEIVFHRNIKLHVTGDVGAVIQVAVRILIDKVNGGRNFLFVQRQYGKHRFQTTCTS